VLFTHPANRFDLPFTTLTGLVDCDLYHDNWVHFPAHWHDTNFSGVLPKRITHTYGAAGTYRVIVGPVAPCTGKFTETLNVLRRGGSSITGIDVSPAPASIRQSVTITVLGSGTCAFTIDFGDGNAEERTKPLPDRVAHVYSAPDTYTIAVRATSGCTGSVRRALTVLSVAQQ